MNDKKKIAIIGGGFTGLACAQTLIEAGAHVVVFEKAERLGGLASGFQARGWRWSLEHFYHHWFASDAAVRSFARKWGLEAGLRFSEPSTVMQLQAGSFSPLDSAIALLRYPGMPFFDRVRMGLALALLKATRSWKPLEGTTAQAWCVRMMGRTGFEAVWGPLLQGKFGPRWASKVNMAWLWARIACRTKSLGTFEGGFARFVEGARSSLETAGVTFRLGANLERFERAREKEEGAGGGWLVGNIGSAPERFDAVIVAAAPSALSALSPLPEPSAFASAAPLAPSESLPCLGAQVVIFALKKSVGPHYWYSLRKSSNQPFLALIEHTNFIPKENFSGETIVYLADYVETTSFEWKRTDEELRTLAFAVCSGINPSLEGSDLLESWILREPYAQPIPLVNHGENVPALAVAGAPGLFHASMAHVYPWDRGTNFALELGERVAKAALELELR